jgi:TetR/AcrR family transcriptional regulator, regulator of autoinduction and epiphytic fitness
VTRGKEPTLLVDGRHARGERTRDAIVDALLALLEEGDLRPSAERVAERAGVSRRVLFNHFRDLEDLLTRAAARRLETIRALWPALPLEGTLDARAAAFCANVGRFHEQIAPMRRAALLIVHESAVVASHMREAARMHRTAVEAVFAPELAAASAAARDVLARGLAAATSFSTWDELRRTQELSVEEAEATVRGFVEGILARARQADKTRA